MFSILSLIFRYLFILLIYLFMFGIIRMIYLDIKISSGGTLQYGSPYLKLINRKDALSFKIKEEYILDSEVIIGRANGNDIILKDPFVSKRHAKITKDEDEFFLIDMESANGTFVNGNKVLDVVMLKNGDRIKLGEIEFLFVNPN